MLKRTLTPHIESWLFKGKLLLLFGARQVGKTTLCKELLKKYSDEAAYFLCERPVIRETLQSENLTQIKALFGSHKLVVLDEAQVIDNIGLILKLFHDEYPETQIIASGSSSFELANRLSEPMTGRAIQFVLYPLSVLELESNFSHVELQEKLTEFLRFGLYPGIIMEPLHSREELLINLSEQYLYKDILHFENLKNSKKIVSLLKLLALQIGSEVSIHELAVQLGFSRSTVERFLDLLEKMFIIFRLGSFSRNLRKEISKKSKYYFYDLGIRNAILNSFATMENRQDVGALWENFCVLERIKFLHNQAIYPNTYFWRTHDQQEIDYLEERNNYLQAFEFKWGAKKTYVPPKLFVETYPNSKISLITQANWSDLLVV
ncbi:MAG TPA: ATP-binding protein [Coxiellaceae bacterium]|nr:ATP-binding protein [Coxiellaceae bacterium]